MNAYCPRCGKPMPMKFGQVRVCPEHGSPDPPPPAKSQAKSKGKPRGRPRG